MTQPLPIFSICRSINVEFSSGPAKRRQRLIETFAGLRGANHPEIRPMKRKRRDLTAEFKARVANEALEGEKSIQ
jgi:hypothetical protein